MHPHRLFRWQARGAEREIVDRLSDPVERAHKELLHRTDPRASASHLSGKNAGPEPAFPEKPGGGIHAGMTATMRQVRGLTTTMYPSGVMKYS
jgi:hypothetical protein